MIYFTRRGACPICSIFQSRIRPAYYSRRYAPQPPLYRRLRPPRPSHPKIFQGLALFLCRYDSIAEQLKIVQKRLVYQAKTLDFVPCLWYNKGALKGATTEGGLRMSELAYRHQESTIYTETEGNLTRIFFGQSEAMDTAAPDLYQAATTNESQAPDDHLTPRQKELAKPDSRDMAVVPLESYDQLRAVIDWFESRNNYREACLLTFGFCTGLRISDLLQLKISDIVESIKPMVFKRAIDIREQKTGKRTVGHLDDMLITPAMQEAFSRYISHKKFYEKELDMYLFTSTRSHGARPMSVSTIQLNLAPAFAAVCPHLHCSTHTMRKTFVSIIHTFATQATMTGAGINPATACQIALRHANAATTMAYMGTMKSGMLSLRQAVSDFVMGKTKIRSLKTQYTWETIDD